ncbi:MAG TPA: DUF5666 domain-containing protein [Anaerolineales bacterium]|nr:DUF5666 domain-containing protein [Anaerolineales bacterium]
MNTIRIIRVIVVVLGLLLSACGAPATQSDTISAGNGKPLSSEFVFTGVIESMSGDQWVINGQTVKVDASVVRDGSFQPGDIVKVEGQVEADGTIVALRIETPTAADLATPTGGLVFDDDDANDDGEREAFGVVDAITADSITIGGQTFSFLPDAEIKDQIAPGDFIKVHLVVTADGTLLVREVELFDRTRLDNDNDDEDDNMNQNDNGNDNDDDDRDDNENQNENDDDNGNQNDNSNDDDDNGNQNENDNDNDDDDDDDNSNNDNDDDDDDDNSNNDNDDD